MFIILFLGHSSVVFFYLLLFVTFAQGFILRSRPTLSYFDSFLFLNLFNSFYFVIQFV